MNMIVSNRGRTADISKARNWIEVLEILMRCLR